MLATLVNAPAAQVRPARDPAVEGPIVEELRRAAPAAAETFVAATAAFDADDYAKAETLYRQVLASQPDFDAALRRLGAAVARLGRRKEGMELLERAVAVRRTMPNLISLARELAYPDHGEATRAERERALELALECRTLPGGDDRDVLATLAQLGFQLDRPAVAKAATETLLQRHPDDFAAHYFAAIVAAIDEHWIRASDEIHRAQELGLDPAAAERFLASGIRSRALGWRVVQVSLWAVVAWVGGLGLLYVVGFLLSRATLRQIEVSDPAVPVNPGELRLRKFYRAVLNVAGIYYYVSLPIVAVLVVGLSGGLVYGFLMLGTIPIKLTIIIVIGAVATVWAMGRSLFLKVNTTDPGRALRREEAPRLWELAESVAHRLQTRPVDEIRLTVGTDLCVYERGTWREKMQNRAQRVLVIGAAVLNDFKQEHFRSVLAHEYGHFANRDTAGGDIALRVQNDMIKFVHAMVRAGQATWLNAAFHFLRFYDFLFRRISHGATRLQEVLADRVAAQAYGAAAFEGGLRHVIRAAVDFEARADLEVTAARVDKRPLRNLYDNSIAAPSLVVERNFADLINRPTTEDDTHPGPNDRFRLVQRVPIPATDPLAGDVWDLFHDRDAVLREMMETVQKNVALSYA
ncbi:MAG: tetratricopeptide repeat protein [Candidatus Didemnitutus sp.]|nr:tetratricopeptide repeat protein [Candidatus Didemnitutus sp.]